jgi:SCY1-like protein 1
MPLPTGRNNLNHTSGIRQSSSSVAENSIASTRSNQLPSIPKAKGMQLGANKVPAAAAMAAKLADEIVAEDSHPWESDDLIDVNADQDDWSESNEQPAPKVKLHPTFFPSQVLLRVHHQ